jgi:cell division protein FtsI (penicillin-binding protein 3)
MTGTLAPPRPARSRVPPPPPPRRPAARKGHLPRRRLVALLVGLVLAFGAVAARMVHLQAFSRDRLVAMGESQRVRAMTLPAERGSIFDRDGRELALSVRQSTVWADPRLVTDPMAAAEALAPVLQLEPAELQTRLTRDAAFVYLARKVDDATAQRVKELGLSGISLMDEPERFLPAGDLAASLLGRVGVDNNGLSGLESQFEKQLRGRPGRMVVERDPEGREIPGGMRQFTASVRGDDLVLTIDRSLQYETERALAAEISKAHAKGGMAIVMQTRTGDVLAMANLKVADDGTLQPAPNNMALTNVYEPGSVSKMITVGGAMEEGLVRADDRLTVPSTIKVADHVFKEHDPHPTEEWSITDIVANSSNVGSILIGQKLGKNRMDHYMRAFGFGEKTALKFPGESAGLLLDPGKYSGTSMATMSIGQGVAVTAMQMLAAYNTVANGGVYVAPKLVRATIDGDGQRHETAPADTRRVISAKTARQMTSMLNEVVRVGTGKLAAIDGYTVAGKTGTARKPLEHARGYKEGAYVSSFAGFVPSEQPELSAIVMLDEPTPIFGGLVAAPVFAEVMRYGLRQFRIPPPAPGAPAPSVPASNPAAARGVGEVGEGSGPGATTTIAPSPPRTP